MVRRKSSWVFFQEDLVFSSWWCRRGSCLGRNSANSVPWILCLAESKGLRFLAAARSHILVCFSNDCGMKVRAQIAQGNRIGGSASASIYNVQRLMSPRDFKLSRPRDIMINIIYLFFYFFIFFLRWIKGLQTSTLLSGCVLFLRTSRFVLSLKCHVNEASFSRQILYIFYFF